MRLSELLNRTDVKIAEDREVVDLTDRADEVRPGWGFVCRQGARTDGHRFAAEAVKNGAATVFTARDLGLKNQIICDTDALWPMLCAARFGYPDESICVIGVTGTNGKTSACTMTRALLSMAGHSVGQLGTVENRVGDMSLPATQTTLGSYELMRALAVMRDAGCTHGVMEVSSHALAQHRADGIRFAVGAFTNLTQDHLDFHGTMERYAAAKKRLFSLADAAVVNSDDPYAGMMTDGFAGEIVTTSLGGCATLSATGIHAVAGGTGFTLRVGDRIFETEIPLPGRFSVANALTAVGICVAIGEPIDRLVRGLPRLPSVSGRAEVIGRYRGGTVIRDYAHTPDGLLKIGQAVKPQNGRLILLFGCGGDRDKSKRPLMAKAAAEVADYLLLTSDNPRSEDPLAILRDTERGLAGIPVGYRVIESREAAIEAGLAMMAAGDVFLLAGKGHETTQVLADKTVPFDEREIVQRWIELHREVQEEGR